MQIHPPGSLPKPRKAIWPSSTKYGGCSHQIIVPLSKIPVREWAKFKQRANRLESLTGNRRKQLDVLQQTNGDQSGPALYHNSILARPHEGLYPESWSYGFEKSLYGQPLFLNCRDGRGGEVHVVDETNDLPMLFLIMDHDATKLVRTDLGYIEFGKDDFLTRQY